MLRRLRSIAALVAVTARKSTHQQRPQQAWRCLSTTTTRSSSVDLVATGVAVLQAADPMHKVELTRHLAQQLQVDRGGCNAGDSGVTSPQLATTTLLPSPDYRQWKAVAACIPQQPARPAEPRLVEPKAMKRPRGVPLAVYLLHSVAHIELNAIGTHSVTACSWCCSWCMHTQTPGHNTSRRVLGYSCSILQWCGTRVTGSHPAAAKLLRIDDTLSRALC